MPKKPPQQLAKLSRPRLYDAHVQLVNKMVELKLGEGGYVKYDVYILR